MAIRSWLLTVSVIVEQHEQLAAKVGPGWRTDDELQEVVTAALAQYLAKRPEIEVEWVSMSSAPLDDKPAVGQCTVCDRWVFDVEKPYGVHADPDLPRGDRGRETPLRQRTYPRITLCHSEWPAGHGQADTAAPR